MGKPRRLTVRQIIALLGAVAGVLQAVATVLKYLPTCRLTVGRGLTFAGWPPDHAESVDVTGVVFKRYAATGSLGLFQAMNVGSTAAATRPDCVRYGEPVQST